jgi:hypothetical protein
MRYWFFGIIIVLTLAFIPRGVGAQTRPDSATEPASQPAPSSLTVSILDFDADVPGSTNLGHEIGEILSATLSGEPGITLVDRSSFNQVLQENELNLTGLVDTNSAIKIGKLVGAKILVTGRAFAVDKSIFLTAKLIGTETSLVEGVVVKADQGQDLSPMIVELSGKIADRIRSSGSQLVAGAEPADPIPDLKEKLSGLALPTIELQIPEQQIDVIHVIDPAADTELRKMLTDCGFTVIDADEVTPAKAGVGVIIKGSAVSESAGQIAGLHVAVARMELSAVKYSDGKILFATRTTARSTDLSEQIAGKSAIQKCAHELGIQLLNYFSTGMPVKSASTKP